MTLIELLVVIGIITLLISLVVIGYAIYGTSAEMKATRTRLAVLRNMTDALAATKSSNPDVFDDFFYSNPMGGTPTWRVTLQGSNPGTNPSITAASRAELEARTVVLMHRLAAIPANRTAISNLPVDQKSMPAGNGYIANPTVPLVLDPWGKVMVYVPREGITGLSGKAAGKRLTSAGLINLTDNLPANAHGFWISSGYDMDLTTGDDNINSFED
jgi:type II secretory pathway pseudopilin PulG